MAVTVTLISDYRPTVATVHEHGTGIDVDFDHLYVYSATKSVIASYAKGTWLSAVVS